MTSALENHKLTRNVAALIALAAGLLVFFDRGQGGVRAAIVLTARCSLVLFLSAYSASALARFAPSRFTRWQLRNRRYLGLSFAASHALHALAIGLFWLQYPRSFADHVRSMPVGPGLIVYALIAALAVTSNDRAVRWLGARRWKLLHNVGSLAVWLAFFKAVLSRTATSAGYWLPVAALASALLLRLATWALSKRTQKTQGSSARERAYGG